VISRLTRIQLVVFAIVTVLGGAYVGGKYAQVDRLVIDRTYPVTVELPDSGGIFAGAQVTYRGIPVGRVSALKFTDAGVEAKLDIEKSAPDIPADLTAVVANKSAIGEQYMDLQPKHSGAPFLKAGTRIAVEDSKIPLDTATLLIDVNDLVKSVDTENLSTLVSELGQAFEGTGEDLGTILDTSNQFIGAATDNLPVTRALIRDSASVLQTQVDTQSALKTYAQNLANLSDTLVDSDPDLRRLLDKGTVSARTLNTVVQENAKDLTVSFNNLASVSEVLAPRILGLRAIFVLYPFLVEGSYGVVQPSTETGEWDATFGLVVTPEPATCTWNDNGGDSSGYRKRRSSSNITDVAFPDPATVDCLVKDNHIVRQASKTQLNRSAAGAPGEQDSLTWLMLDQLTQ